MATEQPPDSPTPDSSPRARGPIIRVRTGHRLRRRTRWLLRILIGLPLVLVILIVIMTRSPLLKWQVARAIEAEFGCKVHASTIVMHWDGHASADNIRLTIPTLDGPPSEFLRAAHVDVGVSLVDLLRFRITPTEVRLYEPVFSLYLDPKTGRLNIDDLGFSGSGDAPAAKILVINGRLDFGEFSSTGADGALLRSIMVSGEMSPVAPNSPEFSLSLTESAVPASAMSPGAATPSALRLDGLVNLQTDAVQITLHNLRLTDWPPETVPASMRRLWSELDIRGEVSKTILTSDPDAGVAVSIVLDNVSMNAPIPADRPEIAGDRLLPLSRVSGDIRFSKAGLKASLAGVVGNLPARVALTTDSLSFDGALRCEITTERFEVGSGPALLPYAPEVVRRRFAMFSGPTAVVDARVLLSRAAPVNGVPGALSISGSIAFENGRAAFERFPYPVEHLKGLVTFNDEKVDLVNIQGRGPTGAIVSGNGIIAPPTDGAGFKIDVLALDVPVDDVLMNSLEGERREIVDALLSQPHYDDLIKNHLVITPKRRDELRQELADLTAQRDRLAAAAPPAPDLAEVEARLAAMQRMLETPVFDFGGQANLSILVESPVGVDAPIYYTVKIAFPKAGLVPSKFPFPIVASDVALTLTDEKLTLDSGRFTGLRGGDADLTAVVLLPGDDNPNTRPDITINARGVPVDDLLVNAIPDDETPGEADGGAARLLSTKSLLQSLRIEGFVSSLAHITTDDAGTTAAQATVTLNSLTATPPPAPGDSHPGVSLQHLSGDIHLTEGEARIPSIKADLVRLIPSSDPALAGRLDLALESRFPDQASNEPGHLTATLGISDLDLSTPIEDLLQLFSEPAAATVRRARAVRDPAGRIDGDVRVAVAGRGDPGVSVRVEAARDLALNAAGGRVSVDRTEGPFTYSPGAVSHLDFDHTTARLLFDNRPVLAIALNGSVLLPGLAGATTPEPPRTATVTAGITNADLQCPLVRAVISRAAAGSPMDGEDPIDSLDPAGRFDAQLDITSALNAGVPAYGVGGSISPRILSFTRAGTRINLPDASGSITIDGSRGRLEALRLANEQWSVTLDGAWAAPSNPGEAAFTLDTSIAVSANGLTPDLEAMLPEQVRSVIRSLSLDVRGPVALSGARLRLDYPPAGAAAAGPSNADFHGDLSFSNASMDIGFPVVRAEGSLAIGVEVRPGQEQPAVDLSLHAPSLIAAKLDLTNVFARLVSSASTPGRLLVPVLTGELYGGRVSATASIGGDPGDDAPTAYKADVVVAGSRFSPILNAYSTPDTPAAPTDESRGRLDASLSISGVEGDSLSRTGRGSVRIAGGDVIRLPLALPLMQLSNLQLPSADPLDYFQTAFTLSRNTLTFEQISLMSESISLIGSGTVGWPTTDLDLRFNSQSASTRRIPLVSDLLEGVRNELISTRVTGTLADPKFTTETLAGTRKMVEGFFSGGSAGGPAPPNEKAVRSERDRIRSSTSVSLPREGR
ncbi:MAG: AsmA-like C-terminal domain-containing protein [Phycisphaeraceae bacterium]|nr:AsmA-like C-terminal domain-containing protein [Phycisphaeraceae bacterium]